jgi:uncharacterized protein (TIGR00297 family)
MPIVSFSFSFWLIISLLIVSGITSYLAGKLTPLASGVGVVIAVVIYAGAGFAAICMLAIFFVLGSVATSYKKDYKQKMRLADATESRRNLGQVLANAGVPAILASINIAAGYTQPLLLIMVAASFASAMGDTISSEFGNVYGRNFYNALTLKKDKRGLNGVISVEGTLFGIAGSILIAFIYAIFYGWNIAFFVITISGIVGNLSDSLLGALFERNGYLGNDAVNFLNTAIAAVVALLLVRL